MQDLPVNALKSVIWVDEQGGQYRILGIEETNGQAVAKVQFMNGHQVSISLESLAKLTVGPMLNGRCWELTRVDMAYMLTCGVNQRCLGVTTLTSVLENELKRGNKDIFYGVD